MALEARNCEKKGTGSTIEKDSIIYGLLVTVDRTLTSRMAAQGAGTASNVVPVMEHVIGLA